MSIELHPFLETAADEVASASRAAAGAIGDLAVDWGHEARSFVSELAPALPMIGAHRRGGLVSHWRWIVPVVVVTVVAAVAFRRRRRQAMPQLTDRQFMPTVGGSPDERQADALRVDGAAGAAAS
jgi:hypothetical protein